MPGRRGDGRWRVGFFCAAATVVGSFPHTDAVRLVDQLIVRLPELPAWPQLPARDWRESMYVQYSEHLPGAVIDDQAQRKTGRATCLRSLLHGNYGKASP